MDLIADILLIGGAIGAAFYCFILSRRLTRFTDLERGVGGAVAVLSAQVDDLKRALDRAKTAADSSGDVLRDLTDRADQVARKLELSMAALHDVDEAPAEPVFARREAVRPAEVSPVAAAPTAPPPFAATRSGASAATKSFFSQRVAAR